MQTYEEKMAETNRIEALGQAWLDANAPKNFKAWIVAELEENQSDLMTDYHGSKTTAKIPLAFSKHTRNLFPEMRKAAAKYDAPGLKILADSKPGEYEERQTYSMGGGMFLGANRYSGWKIRKFPADWGTRDLAIKIGQALENGERLPIMGDAVVAAPQPAPIDTTTTRNAARTIQAVPCSVEQNYERNGVEIKFSEKPSAEDRQTLKDNGFRWSRFNSVWWAVATEESLAFAETLIPEPEAEEEPEIIIDPYVSPADFAPVQIPVSPFFIFAKRASLNKNATIEEYREECQKPELYKSDYHPYGMRSNWTLEETEVTEVWELTPDQYNQFTHDFLSDGYEFIAGKGDTKSHAQGLPDVESWFDLTPAQQEAWKAEAYNSGVLVICPGRQSLIIDPQGYNYARYVCLVENENQIIEALKAQVQPVPTTPASTWEVITEPPSFEPAMFSAAAPEAIADRAISIAQKIAQVLNDKPELVKADDNEIVRQYLQLQLLPVLA